MKKKFPIKTFVTVTLRHPMSDNPSVVSVVAKAPMASAVWVQVRGLLAQISLAMWMLNSVLGSSIHTGLPSCDLVVMGTGTRSLPPFGGVCVGLISS